MYPSSHASTSRTPSPSDPNSSADRFLPPPTNLSRSESNPTRTLAIATLRRAASTRDTPASTSNATTYTPSSTPSGSSLQRQTSLLARSIAMAKLTGEPPPNLPVNFYPSNPFLGDRDMGPLPTLDELRARAERRAVAGGGGELKRNNTSTGIVGGRQRSLTVGDRGVQRGSSVRERMIGEDTSLSTINATPVELDEDGRPVQGEGRAAARVNLMRKLSSRRLESPAPSELNRSQSASGNRLELLTAGRGANRPRSGSLPLLHRSERDRDQSRILKRLVIPSPIPLSRDEDRRQQDLISQFSPETPAATYPYHLEEHEVELEEEATPRVGGDGMKSSGNEEARFQFSSSAANSSTFDPSAYDTLPNEDAFAPPPRNFDSSRSIRTSGISATTSISTSSSANNIPLILHRGSTSVPSHLLSTSPSNRSAIFPTSISSLQSLDPVPVSPARETSARPPLSTFGIRAVEESAEDEIRRRGSSASSSIGGFSLIQGGIGERSRSNAGVGHGLRGSISRNSISFQAGAKSALGLGMDLGYGDSSTSLRLNSLSSSSTEEEASKNIAERANREQSARVEVERVDEIERRDLLRKVEKNREMGLARSREGAFPPPEVNYQFPAPAQISPKSKEADMSWPTPVPGPSADLSASLRQRQQAFYTASPHAIARARSPIPPAASPAPRNDSVASSFPSYSPPPTVATLGVPIASTHSNTPSSREHSPTPSLSSSPLGTSLSRESSKRKWFGAGIFSGRGASPSTSLEGADMERNASNQSRFSIKPGKAISYKEEMRPDFHYDAEAAERTSSELTSESMDSVLQSTYSSSADMHRDLSSSSTESLLPIPVRHHPLPQEELPSSRILAKLETLLGPQELDPHLPSILDSPPRRLLLHTPVLQVVNAGTVKDRHLFLFSDLLLIAKPIFDGPPDNQSLAATLASSFVVKSIVELRHLRLAAVEDSTDDANATKQRHPLLIAFVDRFANDPKKAIAALIQKGGLSNDAPTIANLLFRNPDLNRNQVGTYLASPDNRHILRAFIERFRFAGVRIDDALRIFYLAVRLPHSLPTIEYVLGVVATQWTETNGAAGFDPSLSIRLIMEIMRLSDALHASSGLFGPSQPSLSVDEFVANFREHDPRLLVPEDLLNRIYASIRQGQIEEASDNSMFSMTPDIDATVSPAKLPTRLTYRTPSELISITLPAPDPKFAIKLHGIDLKFDPPYINFAKSATQSFRVTGTSLGVRVMVFIKLGANSSRYQGLPLNKAFSIERAFMQHTFQISFVNHLDIKRKYMFSTLDSEVRSTWIKAIRECTADCLEKPLPTAKSLVAADAVAIQVLRDALIAEDLGSVTSSAAPNRLNTAAPRLGTASSVRPPPTRVRLGGAARAAHPLGVVRSNSFSKTYAAGVGKAEAELGNDGRKLSTAGAAALVKEELALGVNKFRKSGHEIASIAENNSLLPLMLSMLSGAASVAPHPMSFQGSAFQVPPLNSVSSQHTA